jgi:elongation of very long chain fatty acids protein 7
MYTYYMLAACGPKIQKYLWWKRYLTIIQMVQFVAIFVHSTQLLFYNPCNYPMIFPYALIFHAGMFFLLFKGK